MLPEPENVWRRQFMLNRLSVPMRMPRGHFLEAVRACRFGRSAGTSIDSIRVLPVLLL